MDRQRWLEIVDEVDKILNDGDWVEGFANLSKEECKLVISVLANNIPFTIDEECLDE
ncbi:hypothetical protein Phab24_id123 [Acinetobacter phage Phab24]|nr:hypothetical protein Phab24_id123 [Acinetobacter phage Phab24]